MIILKLIKMAIACVFIVCMFNAEARDYYFHPRSGNDQNSGYSMDQPFQSLQVIKRLTLLPGDRILLASGEVFYGSLQIENLHGKEEAPIIIDSYSVKGANGLKAIINASGYFGGIVIRNSSHIQIRNLEVTANGGGDPDGQWDMRVGVLITNKAGEYLEGITLQGLDFRMTIPPK